ncbi:MAG: AAA family ATPase [Burkholderiaceae bacterium]|jgi:aminoglycoside phosphotransferase family enzyme/predicted kinase|nr:AAA family ATPase [Burkholderiaceae bacterium]
MTDVVSNPERQAELVHAFQRALHDETQLRPEMAETHVSWILLTKDKAYKIKKALKLDFLDFSRLSARRHYCEEEIRLNRRTAPGIYQQVVAIGGIPESPRLHAEPVLEYAVEMKRFPQENEMGHLLRDNRLHVSHIDSLAENVARFHQSLPPLPEAPSGTAYGAHEFVRQGIENNYGELRALFSSLNLMAERDALDALAKRHLSLLDNCRQLIGTRRKNGFIRECHGDLHMGNIVVMDGNAIPFDGIEFAPDFRCVDVICDLAFAFADLLHFGRPDYAWRLLSRYLEVTGDYQGVRLLHLFSASHALVRAKVIAMRCQQVATEAEKQVYLADSHSYLELARDLLWDRRSGLLITCGLPGAGKSGFSLAALGKIGAIRIRSDVERKRHYGLQALQSSAEAPENIYSKDASAITYGILEQHVGQLLEAGFLVIVDAAFLRAKERQRFYQLAREQGVPFLIALITAAPETLLRRVIARQARQDDPSEAGAAVLAMKQQQFEPLSPEELEYTVEIRNEDGDNLDSGVDWDSLKRKLMPLAG